MRCARGTGKGAPRPPTPTARPAAHTRASLTRVARGRGRGWGGRGEGEGVADTFPSFRPPPPPLEGKQKNLREKIRERILPSGLRSGNCPFLPEKLSHWLLSLPRTHPPSHLSLFHLPATHPLLRASNAGPRKLAAVEAEELSARECERRRGDTIPMKLRGGDSWYRRLGSPLPPLPGRSPLDPTCSSTCRARPRSPAAEERTRAPHPRARSRGGAPQPSSLASHPLQSSFTKLSDFLSPKGVELGRKGESVPLPPTTASPEIEGLVPAQNLRQHQFLPEPGGCAEKGWAKGGRVWGDEAAFTEEGWGGVGWER